MDVVKVRRQLPVGNAATPGGGLGLLGHAGIVPAMDGHEQPKCHARCGVRTKKSPKAGARGDFKAGYHTGDFQRKNCLLLVVAWVRQ